MDEQNHGSLQELFEVTHQVPGRADVISAHKLGLGGLCLNSRELRTSSPNPKWLLQVKRATVSSHSADAGWLMFHTPFTSMDVFPLIKQAQLAYWLCI